MATIKKDGGYNALPISYKRGNPIPLDTTAVWYDFESLQDYAKTGKTAYVGQVLTLVTEIKNSKDEIIGYNTETYMIVNPEGELKKLGKDDSIQTLDDYTTEGKSLSLTYDNKKNEINNAIREKWKPGWIRILNSIRVSVGSIDIGLVTGRATSA